MAADKRSCLIFTLSTQLLSFPVQPDPLHTSPLSFSCPPNHLPLISQCQLSLPCDDLDHQLSNLAGIWHKNMTPSPKHHLLAPPSYIIPFFVQSILLLLLSE